METKVVKGYKVFDKNWVCRDKQYKCPGIFEEDGEIEICEHGMHFCQNLIDCFNYYQFNPENKVAEVIAYGKIHTKRDKSCTNKLEIVREISWEEVLKMLNVGKENTGRGNVGNRNSGEFNTGNYNSGDYNSGDYNEGRCNTGNYNVGNYNIGKYNTGNFNIGHDNSGVYNIGYGNIGDYNVGNWNISSYNTGCFMTKEPTMAFFNKPSNWTFSDWKISSAKRILSEIPFNIQWICNGLMSEHEKSIHPEYITTNGYLKKVSYIELKEIRQAWYDSLTEKEKDIIKSIPNFDAKIFEECTLINVNKQ